MDDAAAHLRAEHRPGGPIVDRFGLSSLLSHSQAEPPAERPRARLPRAGASRRRGGAGRADRRPANTASSTASSDQNLLCKVDEGVLRLEATNLEGVDTFELRFQLMRLPSVASVGIDIAAGLVDLVLARGAHVRHLMHLARARAGLRLEGAELHSTPPAGGVLGSGTLIGRLE
ncbi:MAG: hypothetical protein IT307_08305 [Chloroflexi bacterium]|nr:hypothetical protein [Chloroflexota bacterium]